MRIILTTASVAALALSVAPASRAQQSAAPKGYVAEHVTPLPDGGPVVKSSRAWQPSAESKTQARADRAGFNRTASRANSKGQKSGSRPKASGKSGDHTGEKSKPGAARLPRAKPPSKP